MGKDPQSQPSEQKNAGTTYFLIGSGLLLLMAFVWSIDSSFIYILLGVSTFFFFLGFRNYFAARPIRESFSKRVRETYRTPPQQEEKGSVLEDFSELLKQAQQRAQAAAAQPGMSTKAAAGKKTTLIVMFFLSAIFFIIILSVAISNRSDQGESSEEIRPEYTEDATPTDLGRADDFYTNQQWDSAYIYYKRALKQNPEDPYAVQGYGSTLYMLNYPDSALMMYDKTIALDPDFDLARYNKAWVYYDRKNYSQALTEVRALLSKSPEYNEAYMLQGDILNNQGEYQAALKSYEGAYNNQFRSNGLCKAMADLYSRQGDTQKAIGLFKEALTYDSTDVYTYRRLGEMVPGDEGNYYRLRGQTQ